LNRPTETITPVFIKTLDEAVHGLDIIGVVEKDHTVNTASEELTLTGDEQTEREVADSTRVTELEMVLLSFGVLDLDVGRGLRDIAAELTTDLSPGRGSETEPIVGTATVIRIFRVPNLGRGNIIGVKVGRVGHLDAVQRALLEGALVSVDHLPLMLGAAIEKESYIFSLLTRSETGGNINTLGVQENIFLDGLDPPEMARAVDPAVHLTTSNGMELGHVTPTTFFGTNIMNDGSSVSESVLIPRDAPCTSREAIELVDVVDNTLRLQRVQSKDGSERGTDTATRRDDGHAGVRECGCMTQAYERNRKERKENTHGLLERQTTLQRL